MNSALPPPVLTGVSAPVSSETWIVHGATTTANAAASSAPAASPRQALRRRVTTRTASSANRAVRNRYSGRRNAVTPNSAPDSAHAHGERPSSAAHRNARIAETTVSIASGSPISSPA